MLSRVCLADAEVCDALGGLHGREVAGLIPIFQGIFPEIQRLYLFLVPFEVCAMILMLVWFWSRLHAVLEDDDLVDTVCL